MPERTVYLWRTRQAGDYAAGGDGVLELPGGVSSAILEAIPQQLPGGPAPAADIYVQDASAQRETFDTPVDADATQLNLNSKFKWLVSRLLPFVSARLVVRQGQWTVRATFIPADKQTGPAAGLATANSTGGVVTAAQGAAGGAPWPVSLPASLPAGSNTIGVTQSTIEALARAGQAFVWSPGRLAPASGQNVRCLISNPAGSGRTLYLYARQVTDDTAQVLLAALLRDPSVGLPALGAVGAGIANQQFGAAGSSVAQVGADISAVALAAGTGAVLTTEAVVGMGRQSYVAALYVVPPGHAWGWNLPVGASTPGVTPECSWFEQ